MYVVPKRGSVYEANSGLRLISEFAAIEGNDDKKMRFVMLVADYKSPLRHHPDQKRRNLAALEAGWTIQDNALRTLDFRGKKVADGKDKAVEAAIAKYRELQKDEDMELLALYDSQIENIRATLSVKSTDVDELKKRSALLEGLPELAKAKRELAKTTGTDVEILDETPVAANLSLIDRVAMESKENE